jgi:uncharacterized protein YjiS (DUF1127 family)
METAMNVPCLRPAPVATPGSRISRLAESVLDGLACVWRAWRVDARHRQRLRALAHLTPETLRDIGLETAVPPCLDRLSALDRYRSPW